MMRRTPIWKFVIPATEYYKVLKSLDEHNLNGFSLFGSEEGLMESLAIREMDLTWGAEVTRFF